MIKQLYLKVFFSQKSHYLLNHFTLTIKDPLLNKQAAMGRARRLTYFLKPIPILCIFNVLIRSLIYVYTEPKDLGYLLAGLIEIFLVIGMIVMSRYSVLHAPKLMFIYTLVVSLVTNLSCRDMLPEGLNQNKYTVEYDLFICVQVCNLINCNSFSSTLLVWTPMVLLSYLAQLFASVDQWLDPITGVALDKE